MAQDAQAYNAQHLDLNARPESVRLSEWQDALARTVLRLDVEPAEAIPFRSNMTMVSLPGASFGTVNTSACRVRRTPELVKDCRDDLALVAVTKGTAIASFGRREVAISEGEAVLLRNSNIGTVQFPSETQYYNFIVPEKPLASRVPDVDAACLQVIPVGSSALRLATRYADFLLDDNLISEETHRPVASHFHDLIATMIGGSAGIDLAVERGDLRAARLCAIKADILRNLDNHRLSVAQVAARHDITPRYVSKLFESEGTTFSRFLRERRLDRAYQMLRDPRFTHCTISWVAINAGFGDISHFNHSFRRRFGMTPSDIRGGEGAEYTPRQPSGART